jgi:gamma-glutamyltranspeptidase/glutathione hydrolase
MPSPRRPLPLLVLLVAVGCGGTPARTTGSGRAIIPSSRPQAPPPADPAPIVERGAVASPEPLASLVGADILRRGGNAVDAAIAVGFAIAVTFPSAGNLGGGGFMLVHLEGGHDDVAIDYRETAPAAAHRDMFLDARGRVVEGSSTKSHKASGVPGTVAGLWLAHRQYGSLPWRDLVAPAIALARADRVYDPKVPAADQKDLARTLERIAEGGRDGFYLGETARLVAEEMRRGGGLITEADLAGYQARERAPVAGTYRGHRVVSMPPPSSGGVILVQMLHMLEDFQPGRLGHNRTGYMHLLAEIEKRAFADRAAWLGDSDFYDVPVATLISKSYAQQRARDIDVLRRTDPGAIQEGPARESPQTTHFSIVDRWGNAVANTTTLNDSHGSGIIVRGAGFLLNNEMDDFSMKPGVPNMYGVTGGEANAIAPGKRMLSSMCPTFVYKPDGALWLVLGTPGGPTIFTTVFQVILNRLEHGLALADAVAAPRFHHQWPPLEKGRDVVIVERGIDGRGLVELGYQLRERRIGDVHAVEIDRAGRRAVAASDPRGTGEEAYE